MKNANTKNIAANVAAPAAPVAKRAPRAAVKKAEFVGPVAAPAKADAMSAMIQQADIANKIAAQEKAAAPAKKARAVRPAQKPVEQKESAIVANVAALPVKYIFTGARPTAGRALFAYTEALLQLLGMYKGGAADRKALTDLMGSTAVAYHIKNGNLNKTTKGIELSVDGINAFKARAVEGKFDPKDVEGFTAILTTGQADNRLVKNQGMIKAYQA